LHAQLQPSTNQGGRLTKIQGPWVGQELDPLDLKGPRAIPTPVKIGSTDDFAPIFDHLAKNVIFAEAKDGKRGFELMWMEPSLEFERGIVYEDGRLDLCKKVRRPNSHWTSDGLFGIEYSNSAFPPWQYCHFNYRCLPYCQVHAKIPNSYGDLVLGGLPSHSTWTFILDSTYYYLIYHHNLWFKRNPFGPNSSGLLAE
jgi:hypothetical protein